MPKLTSHDYNELVKKASPNTNSAKNVPLAFLVGGIICAIGEGLMHLYRSMGVSEQNAPTLVSISLVFLGALLTGLDLYDNIAQHAGAGTLVPITGFSNAMTAPAMDFKSEGYVLGLGAKMFSITGPVLVYGLSAGVVYGLILYLFKLY